MVKTWYVLGAFFCLSIVGGVLWYIHAPFNRWCNAGAAVLISPILKMQHVVLAPVKKYCQTPQIYELQQQVHDIEQERDQLVSEIVALKSSKEFVNKTQELVRYKKRYQMDPHTLAHIILKQLNEHEQYVLIDQGSTRGVQKDMVAVYKNALIGKVTDVYPYWSKVLLITDPLCNVAAVCAHTKASGIAEGVCDAQHFAMTHVNHLDTIKEGDYIISSGAGLVFPKGFGLGTIESFAQDGLFYIITAKPLISIERIEYCYLIQKGTET